MYTYSIMAASGIGYFIAKRGGYVTMPLGVAFIAAPIFAVFQKRELDFYENSNNAMYFLSVYLAFTLSNSQKNSQFCSSSIIRFWERLRMKYQGKKMFWDRFKISIKIEHYYKSIWQKIARWKRRSFETFNFLSIHIYSHFTHLLMNLLYFLYLFLYIRWCESQRIY